MIFRPVPILMTIRKMLLSYYLSRVSPVVQPMLYFLKFDDENDEEFGRISHEDLLLRWINFHLSEMYSNKWVTCFEDCFEVQFLNCFIAVYRCHS